MPPRDPHNVGWNLKSVDPYFRYIWTGGSYVKVNAADFLGKRQLEVTRAHEWLRDLSSRSRFP